MEIASNTNFFETCVVISGKKDLIQCFLRAQVFSTLCVWPRGMLCINFSWGQVPGGRAVDPAPTRNDGEYASPNRSWSGPPIFFILLLQLSGSHLSVMRICPRQVWLIKSCRLWGFRPPRVDYRCQGLGPMIDHCIGKSRI